MIIHNCEACGFPISDGAGFVHVSFEAIRHAQAEQQRRPTLISSADPAAVPTPYWRTHHQACAPDRGDDSYCIDVERLRTWPDLVWWFCQLSGKNWYQLTNWPAVAARMSGQLQQDAALPGGA